MHLAAQFLAQKVAENSRRQTVGESIHALDRVPQQPPNRPGWLAQIHRINQDHQMRLKIAQAASDVFRRGASVQNQNILPRSEACDQLTGNQRTYAIIAIELTANADKCHPRRGLRRV